MFRGIFAFSSGLSEAKAHTDTIIAIYKTLSDEDWDYIIENCHNNMGRWGFASSNSRSVLGQERLGVKHLWRWVVS